MDWKYRLKEWYYQIVSDKTIADHTLVIICNPRSGSTWLFDSLRAHPRINFQKSASFFARFRLRGNRYPGDLTADSQNGQAFEIRPGRVKHLRTVGIEPKKEHHSLSLFTVEKFHPDFYNFDTEKFLQEIKRVQQSGKVIKLLILIRKPAETLRSFKSYQARNPKWFAQVPTGKAASFLERTYHSLAELKRNHDLEVLDYDQYLKDPELALKQVYSYLWPESTYPDSAIATNDIKNALEQTKKEKIKGSNFVTNYKDEIAPNSAELDPIQKHYQSIFGPKNE